ncbi:MAG TPA: hypothetical protein VGM42_08755, partial [Rhodopila sp.]
MTADRPPTRRKKSVDRPVFAVLVMPMRQTLFLAASLLFGLLATGASAAQSRLRVHAASPAAQSLALPRTVTDHFFLSSDGVQLHYL